ncbi:MAG: hypothetical protein COZ75_11865 [Flavobacteriaceae bacterium CG_4_8_14_3_um_filter_34_10]|nr:MAG: hypothetical protein COZ75_11865 [Flavobacteriaceae bacterium CG_4_8_14_3_um_filter_34_10]
MKYIRYEFLILVRYTNVGNKTKNMKEILFTLIILFSTPGFLIAQAEKIDITEIDNAIFKKDNYWRGADGAASIDLENGKILWLFSDTFIDPQGTGKRSNSKVINNSIAIQEGYSLDKGKISFYYKGKNRKPKSFFELRGKTWFWTGHGILAKDKLIIFLIEEKSIKTGIGFEAIGWYIALIDNPLDNPLNWNVRYSKGSDTFGVIVGSSAVLQDENYIYAFGVKEPSTHETYLLRFKKEELINGDLSNMEWWTNNTWSNKVYEVPKSSSLFIGQTEFSVHFDKELKKFIQIQTYGFGQASIGYRLADQLYGPWSEPILFYTPILKEDNEFVYTANAHPEIKSDGLVVTYNINNGDFGRLISNEDIYISKIIKVYWNRDK